MNKKLYIPPTLGVVMVELEQGIAAGSAANVGNTNVSEIWDSQESQESSTW